MDSVFDKSVTMLIKKKLFYNIKMNDTVDDMKDDIL